MIGRRTRSLGSLLLAAWLAGCGGPPPMSPEPPDAAPADAREAHDAATPEADGGARPPPEACAEPAPLRGRLSEGILEWIDVLEDGSLESGESALAIDDSGGGSASREEGSARSGAFGEHLEVAAGERLVVSFVAGADKGDTDEVSVWLRSRGDPVSVRLAARRLRDGRAVGATQLGDPVTVGSDWAELSMRTSTTQGFHWLVGELAIDGPASLDLDDAAIRVPLWTRAEATEDARRVGAIDAPASPRAPVLLTVLMHVEDTRALVESETYFGWKTAVFDRVASILAAHGGALTIQPEAEWVRGSLAFTPAGEENPLARLAREYGVRYSTHTHGPECVDPAGTPLSSSGCSGTTFSRMIGAEDVIAYADERRALIEAAAGIAVTDHNGNFDLRELGDLSEVGFDTLTAFKDREAQLSFDEVRTNPWRPSAADGEAEPELFQTHDPAGRLVYLPGVGQALSWHHERIPEQLERIMSRWVWWADPDRVTTLYVVLHVDHYVSRYETPLEAYYASHELEDDLGALDRALTEVVDPLVEGGYVVWSETAAMRDAFLAWEADCASE